MCSHTNYSEDYWEKCWKSEDTEQLEKYLANFYKRNNSTLELFKANGISHICDVACGFGAYSLLFASNGFRVEGFDISPTSVEITKAGLSKYNIDTSLYKVADILNTGYADETFEGLIVHAVLDHLTVADARKALDELHRIAKPDGLIFISFDAIEEVDLETPHEILKDGSLRYTEGERASMIFHPYTEAEIKTLLSDRNIEKLIIRDEAERIVILRK